MCHSSPDWKHTLIAFLVVTQSSWAHTRSPQPHSSIPAAHCHSSVTADISWGYFLLLLRERRSLWAVLRKKKNWFSLIVRSVKQCSVLFWPNFIFPYLLSISHHTEHMETAQTMNVRIRWHFLQHLLLGRKGLVQKWCKMEQFCTAWHCITTCCQEQCKNFMKKLMIWMKIQGKADISRAVLHFKTARNAKTVKISVALQC